MSLWMIWLIAAVLLIIVEMTTFTFYLLWLGLGALTGSLMALLFPDLYFLQILSAAAVAIILTFFTKRFRAKIQESKGFTDRFDTLVGKSGEVLETISIGSLGIVVVSNDKWSAEADEEIVKGEPIIVISRSSTVLKVAKLKGD